MEEWMKMHRFGKRGGALMAVAVVALAVGAGAAFGTASGSASKAKSAKGGPPQCAKVGHVPDSALAKAPANCKWVTSSAASTQAPSNPTGQVSFRSLGALVGTGSGNTCTVGVSGLGIVCTDLGGGLFEIDFPASTYIWPTLGIPTITGFGADDTLGFFEFLNFDGSANLFIFMETDTPFTFTNTAGHF
jgi:hypothetical protein